MHEKAPWAERSRTSGAAALWAGAIGYIFVAAIAIEESAQSFKGAHKKKTGPQRKGQERPKGSSVPVATWWTKEPARKRPEGAVETGKQNLSSHSSRKGASLRAQLCLP